MYSRFTDEAHSALQRTNQQAQQSGQPFVRGEHLLLALLEPPDSVATQLLVGLRLDPQQLREAVTEAIGSDRSPSNGIKTVIDSAMTEAGGTNSAAGTEHLLLGLVGETNGVAGSILRNAGLTADRLRQAIAITGRSANGDIS